MRITHGNTVLRSLTADDLEMVRRWRNDPDVNAFLLNKEYITEEQQLKWFRELDTEKTLYLMAEERGIPFGLVYATEIALSAKNYNGNILIGDHHFRNGHLPVKVVVMLMWYFFYHLHFETCFSKVFSKNNAARSLNERLGFVQFSEDRLIIEQRCDKPKEGSRVWQFWNKVLSGQRIAVLNTEVNT